MADHRAFAAVSEAVIALLRSNYQPEDFNNELEFRVFMARDFGSPSLQNGVSLFLYRVLPNATYRSPAAGWMKAVAASATNWRWTCTSS